MLGFSPLPRTLEAALRDVENPRADVRLSALEDLRRQARDQSSAAVSALSERLARDPEPRVRAQAALALADSESSAALDAVLQALGDPEVSVRQMALLAVGELAPAGHAAARAAAERALADPRPELRFQSLVAMARLERAAARDALLVATRDSDAEVRHLAFQLADELYADAATELPVALVQRARGALRDDDAAVALSAALLLAGAGDEAGRTRLAEILNRAGRPRHVEDEVAAIEYAGESGLTAARPGLERRAFGPFGRYGALAWHARVALASWGDARAERAILAGLRAWSRDRRTLSVAAAGRARLASARPILEEMLREPQRADPDAVREALESIGAAREAV